MIRSLRLSVFLWLSLTCVFPDWARAEDADPFAGLFGEAVHTSKEIIPRGKGKEPLGYRIALQLPPIGNNWDAYRRTLPNIAEKQFRQAGYEIVISRSIFLDLKLPSVVHIVVRKAGNLSYFSLIASDGGKIGCFLTYEFSTDP